MEPLLGDAACALQDALRGAQRACTLVVQLLELRQPGRRVHAPPGEQFVERGVLRALIPRFIHRRRRLPARHNPAGQRPHDPQVFGYRYGDEWRI